MKVWDAASGQETLTLKGHTDGVYSVAFSPDGEADRQRQWGQNGEGVGRDQRPGNAHAQGPHKLRDSVAFSPDGRRIVSGSGDKTLKVWDATSGQETLTLKGHTDGVIERGLQPRREADRQRQRRPNAEGLGCVARTG